MMNNGTYRFEGVEYPARNVEIPGWGNMLISVESLEQALFDDDGGFKSPEAEKIDKKIFFYVEDGKIGLKSTELANLILENM